jgi:hypothetical protein
MVMGKLFFTIFLLIPLETIYPQQKVPDHLKLKEAIQKGINFLLKKQRGKGFWTVKGYYRRAYPEAITSMCAIALLGLKDPSVKTALKKAQDYIKYAITSRRIFRITDTASACTETRPWRGLFTLSYLSRILATSKDEKIKKELLGYIQKIIRMLERLQLKSGGWSYSDSKKAASFLTAAVLCSLLEAKSQGVKIRERTFKKALKALKTMRRKGGIFVYGKGGRLDDHRTAAGRAPLCELALYLLGEGSKERLQKAVENFFKYRKLLERARKGKPIYGKYHKTGMHHPIFGYFFFFDHYYLALSLGYLDPKIQQRYYPILAREIIKIQNKDGSWSIIGPSSFEGKVYPTAVCISILRMILSKN